MALGLFGIILILNVAAAWFNNQQHNQIKRDVLLTAAVDNRINDFTLLDQSLRRLVEVDSLVPEAQAAVRLRAKQSLESLKLSDWDALIQPGIHENGESTRSTIVDSYLPGIETLIEHRVLGSASFRAGNEQLAFQLHDQILPVLHEIAEELQQKDIKSLNRLDQLSTFGGYGRIAILIAFFSIVVVPAIRSQRKTVSELRSLNDNLDDIIEQRTRGLTDATQKLHTAQMNRGVSESSLQLVIESAIDGIITVDEEQIIESYNPAAEAMFGYLAEEAIGLEIELLIPDAFGSSAVNGNIGDSELPIEQRTQTATEYVGTRKDGTTFQAEVSISQAALGDGELGVAMVRDITERRKVEQDLRDAFVVVERASQAKSEFLARVSHELRTPLNAVIGFSELLSDLVIGELNNKQLRYVSNIESSGRHLLALINAVLDLSKVEAGEMKLECSLFSIRSAIAQVLATTESLVIEKHLVVEVDPDDCPPLLNGDEPKFRQVMYNLVSNAIKFTPENGHIEITTATVTDGSDRSAVRVSVKDTGEGIDAAQQGMIFHEFTQVDSSLSRSVDGTGLGLALVKRLVELHGGKIWVESEGLGHGSVFHFEWPSMPESTNGANNRSDAAQLALNS